ncbi:Cell cycle checkpoint protein rad17 [Xylographa bjoerkii]|nr:Cell cycle checkpoint protein rad17 [Xylographa bjoerkii]
MGPPPAKKQKRSIVLSSDEEVAEEGLKRINGSSYGHVSKSTTGKNKSAGRPMAITLPARAQSKPGSVVKKTNSASSRGSTPALSPRKPKSAASQIAKSGTLHTFFNSVTQSQRVSSKPRTKDISSCVEEQDVIQEVEPFEEHMAPSQSQAEFQSGVQFVSSQSKRFRKGSPESSAYQNKLVGGSQRFKPLARVVRSVISSELPVIAEGRRPWAETFEPSSIEELAVHKRKVTDVKSWLDNAIKGLERKRLLILKGPSGTGKTATVSAIAKSLNLDIVEWKNPAGSDFASDGFRSLSAQFEEFLGRSGKFNGLRLQTSGGERVEQQLQRPYLHAQAEDQACRKRFILLEEFPNTFSRTSSALLSFRSNILQYLVANTPPSGSLMRKQNSQPDVTPLLMIISETLLTTTTAAADSFTAHRLFGPDILNHQRTTVIEFNPISPTKLIKALDLVIQKEARLSGRRRTPGPAVLKKLAEVGDVRSAISSLEFMCVRGDDGTDWGGRVATKSKKGVEDACDLTKMEKESIEMVTQREASLGIFHAVGKVVYNKRDEPSALIPHVELPPQPPDHLSHHSRRHRSIVNVDELMDETGTDTSTFTAALHENYVLSCDGPTSVDSLNGCIDALSDSDLLGSDRIGGISVREGSCHRIYQGSDAESLRQNEICFQVAVRGLLFALPYPVKRRIAQSAVDERHNNKGDAFKMFYPTSMRLWKQIEEVEGLIDRWTDPSTSMCGSYPSTNAQTTGGIEMWKHKSSATSTNQLPLPELGIQSSPLLLVSGNSARTEMILERLPYIAKVECRLPASSRKCELEKMTQFDGIGAATDDTPDYEENDAITIAAATAWATDQSAEPKSRGSVFKRSKVSVVASKNSHSFDSGMLGREDMEKLILSDDDIEED